MSDSFIAPEFTRKNIDTYLIRTSIFEHLKKNCQNFKGELLDVGCGKMPYREFIMQNSSVKKYTGLDIETAIDYGGSKPDVYWDGIIMPFKNHVFDCALATEVFEHCPDPELIMKEICRVLKPGGVLYFTVPFLWPLHEIPHDEYRYTPFALKRLFEKSGFEYTEINASGGWNASLAQVMGLWLTRSGLPGILRIFLMVLFMPLMKLLMRLDKKPTDFHNESTMITGLCGMAKNKDEK